MAASEYGVVWLHNQGVSSCYLLTDDRRMPLVDIRYDEDRRRGDDVYVTCDGREFRRVARPIIWGGTNSRTPGIPVREI